MRADSIDIAMPNQEIKELRAIRKAYAESPPDTARIIPMEPDWLSGDTIIARFERIPAAAPDTGMRSAIKEIVSSGTAKSYVQVAPSGAKEKVKLPNWNYASGRLITMSFTQGKMQDVHVKDQAEGIYGEIKTDSARVRADSSGKASPKTPAAPSPAPKKP